MKHSSIHTFHQEISFDLTQYLAEVAQQVRKSFWRNKYALMLATLLLTQANIAWSQHEHGAEMSISPKYANMAANSTQQFVANMENVPASTIAWSIEDTNGGTISSSGLYQAPAVAGTYRVTAKHIGNNNHAATAIIQVLGPPAANVVVTVKPQTATVKQRGTFHFDSQVRGVANSAVTWSIVNSSGSVITNGGMIDEHGMYMAIDGTPGSSNIDIPPGTYTVRATSLGDVNKISDADFSAGSTAVIKAYAEAQITVTPDSGPWVTVAPSTVALHPNETRTFTAAVEGISNQNVDWRVIEPGGGSVDASGNYTASSTPGFYHLRATSRANSARSFDVEINVEAKAPARYFEEKFNWKGNHAAFVLKGNGHPGRGGTTVWWNEENWEARLDNDYLNVNPTESIYNSPTRTNVRPTGHHLDIHKAESAKPTNGMEDNSVSTIGGDGSTGLGIMRIDHEGKHGARLRNPVVLNPDEPVLVEFYVTRFVTEGHWWEVSFTDANRPLYGQEYTAVPQGIGIHPSEDSLNVVGIGRSHFSCSNTGWPVDVGLHYVMGADEADEIELNYPSPVEQLLPTVPAEQNTLKHWRIELWPNRVRISIDENDTNDFKVIRDFTLRRPIPWNAAYVTLMGVGYQSGHHPGDECWQGIVRELVWRDVKIGPLKYDHTSYAPRNEVTRNVQRELGWINYDRRDNQRVGPPVNGIPQANIDYPGWGSYAFGSESYGDGPPASSTKTLTVNLTAEQANAALTRIIYDRWDRFGLPQTVNLIINGKNPIKLTDNSSQRYTNETSAFHLSTNIPAGMLVAGQNTLRFEMAGSYTNFDGVHLEFAHSTATTPKPVKNDFDGDGKSEILWQHTDGSVYAWLMNGLSISNGGSLMPAGAGWSVAAVGDINGDSKSDIIWRHTDGSVYAWLMSGLSIGHL